MNRLPRSLPGILLGILAASAPLAAQDGAALFTDNCAPCHTVGEGAGVGPDLEGIAARRDRAWLVKFILDPEGVTNSGDGYAARLAKQYGMVMPPPQGLSADAVNHILDYINARSGGGSAGAAAPAAPASPFTTEDVSRGTAIYLGRVRLANGGPSCLTCHSAGAGGPRLGGGTLAPDLGQVVTRLHGPKGTSSWLSAPPTPVMRALFRRTPLAPDEVVALTAFLDDRARQPAADRAAATRRFLALGVGGTIVAFVVIGAAWRNHFRPVRRELIAGAVNHVPAQAERPQGFRSGGGR